MGNYFVTSVEIVISAVFKDSRRSTCGLIWIKSQKVKRCTETEFCVCVWGEISYVTGKILKFKL